MSGRRLSVGFVSPLPPIRSGIADYAAELLSALRAEVDTVPYSPGEAARALREKHDVLFFQIGNDPLHAPSVEALADPSRVTPAVVTLHDFVLHHLFAAAYLDRGRGAEYVRALERAHGERGRELGERNVRGPRLPVWDVDPWAFPLSAGVVADAAAVIVHSRLVRGAVLREHPTKLVVEVPHHVVAAPRTERGEARRALGIPQDRPVAVALGLVTPAKRIARVLEALALVKPSERPVLFVGGAVGADDPLVVEVAELGLERDVVFGGYLSGGDFWKAASGADLAINLRFPTMGETSGAVCRLAGFGLPVIVSDVGWFRELPDAFAAKVPVGRGEVERLAEELARLSRGPEEMRRRAEAARAWGLERSPRRGAALCAAVLGEVAEGWARPLSLSSRLSSALRELGVARPGPFGNRSRVADAEIVTAVAERSAGLVPVRG